VLAAIDLEQIQSDAALRPGSRAGIGTHCPDWGSRHERAAQVCPHSEIHPGISVYRLARLWQFLSTNIELINESARRMRSFAYSLTGTCSLFQGLWDDQ